MAIFVRCFMRHTPLLICLICYSEIARYPWKFRLSTRGILLKIQAVLLKKSPTRRNCAGVGKCASRPVRNVTPRMAMRLTVDRDLPVPLGVQLRGLIEYGITCGELAAGERLPSVRELAEAV